MLDALSRVPQSTNLGMLNCFLTFMNDLVNNVPSETQLKPFANSNLLFREINNPKDSVALQRDLDYSVI